MADTQQISLDLIDPAPQWIEDLIEREAAAQEARRAIVQSPFTRRALARALPVNEVYGSSF